VVLGALLRSADPVFASFVVVHLNVGSVVTHPLLVAIGAGAMGGLFRLATVPSSTAVQPVRAGLGVTEAVVVLVAVDTLLALFAVAQAVAVTGGADHVLRTAGLTYAEYARSGYFQLLWAAGVALALLVGLQTVTRRASRGPGNAFGVAGAAAAALTIVIALVAFRRLALYEHAFGLTMLRVCCQVFAIWLATVFGLLAVSMLGAWPHRDWFVGSAAVAGLVILFGFNAINPEALVARHDVRRGPAADVAYVTTLSEDAVPTVTSRLSLLPPGSTTTYVATVCGRHHRHHGWASFNLSRKRAVRALARLCPG
jgi:hypothetical protein